MVPDQMLRSFLVQYRATLSVVLLLTTSVISLCVVLIEKEQITFTVAPLLTKNQSLLELIIGENGTLYDHLSTPFSALITGLFLTMNNIFFASLYRYEFLLL